MRQNTFTFKIYTLKGTLSKDDIYLLEGRGGKTFFFSFHSLFMFSSWNCLLEISHEPASLQPQKAEVRDTHKQKHTHTALHRWGPAPYRRSVESSSSVADWGLDGRMVLKVYCESIVQTCSTVWSMMITCRREEAVLIN